MLDERKCNILQAIIDDYIITAEPIGSRAIACKHNLGISSATIRNEMSDLELLGYLEQPHASAGRVPSPKGYRFYVDCLLPPTQVTADEVALINNWYIAKVKRIDEVLQETVKMISRITKNVSMVKASQVTKFTFKYLKILPFNHNKVLALIVTDNGVIENKIIDIPYGVTEEDLQDIAEKINNMLDELSIELIKAFLLNEIKHEVIIKQSIIENIIELLRTVIVDETKE